MTCHRDPEEGGHDDQRRALEEKKSAPERQREDGTFHTEHPEVPVENCQTQLETGDDSHGLSDITDDHEPPAGERNPAPEDREYPRDENSDEVATPAGKSGASDFVEEGSHPSGSQPPEVPRDSHAYPPLAGVPSIGDPGRQAEVVPVLGELTLGVSDTELDFATSGPFEVRACSTRGHSHRYSGTPRQDAFALASDENWLVVAVADGVSEGAHSHIAANTAVRVACKLAIDQAQETESIDWAGIAGMISRRIIDEATVRRIVDPQDDDSQALRDVRSSMATTAVVAVISKQSTDDAYPGTLAVLAGDSGAYEISDGVLNLVAGGKQDVDLPILSTAVRPLPGPVNPVVLDFQLIQGNPLILTSDGLGDPIGGGDSEVGRTIAMKWLTPPNAIDFLADVNFLRRSFDDDRTAVGVWVLPRIEAN